MVLFGYAALGALALGDSLVSNFTVVPGGSVSFPCVTTLSPDLRPSQPQTDYQPPVRVSLCAGKPCHGELCSLPDLFPDK